MLEAAENGNTEIIQVYLDSGADVNNKSEDGETMLSRACASGQTVVLDTLLAHPDIHLNLMLDNWNPIGRAAQNGHLDCIRMLLQAETGCHLVLKYGWRGIVKVLKLKPHLKPDSVISILNWAAQECQWEAVSLLLERRCHFPQETLYMVVLNAIYVEKWKIVHDVLKIEFQGKDEILNEVLGLAIKMRLWEEVQFILLKKQLKLDRVLTDAALAEDECGVQRFLESECCDAETLSGCLLVVAAGGTSEVVAQCLLLRSDTYSQETLCDSLYLSAVSQNSEMFLHLLCTAKYSFDELLSSQKVLLNLKEHGGYSCEYLLNCLDSLMKSQS
ncbi:cortactin-binding protein 2-like isoform X2 [Palaemon carinicauda]